MSSPAPKGTVQDAARLLAGSDFKNLAVVQKALHLHFDTDFFFSTRVIAKALNISKSAMQRLVEAERDGRVLGKRGRPFSLKPHQETELKRFVVEKSQTLSKATFKEIGSKVNILYSLI